MMFFWETEVDFDIVVELRKNSSYEPGSEEYSPEPWGIEERALSKEVCAVSQLTKGLPRGLKVSA